jgi:hypothetical protein
VRRRNNAEETGKEEKDAVRTAGKRLVAECGCNFKRAWGAPRQKGWENVGHVF